MSTFSGNFKEIPYISADCFEEHNFASRLFFLSHCHADHMRGLSNLTHLPGPLYTSEISLVFLRKQFPVLQDIQVLEIDTPTELCYTANDVTYKLIVTALPAQHCPGSIMFIFQTPETTILYTGDFRLSKETLERNEFLMSLKFDNIYIDSTFLRDDYNDFPTQMESVAIICRLVERWISRGPHHKVILEMPAQYGYECLFIELNKQLNCKMFIAEHQLEKYNYFPCMDSCFTDSEQESDVIIIQKNYGNRREVMEELQELDLNVNYRIIKPSALCWKHWGVRRPCYVDEGKQVYRVAFSNHCSFNELKDFLTMIKTDSVELNVTPNNVHDKFRMESLLKSILPGFNGNGDETTGDGEKQVLFRNLYNQPKRVTNHLKRTVKDINFPLKRARHNHL